MLESGSGATRILLVEDSPTDAGQVLEILSRSGSFRFELIHVENLAEAIRRLGEGGIDIILLDLMLDDSRGPQTLTRLQAQSGDIPIVVLADLDDSAIAMKAVRSGAHDYLVKGQTSSTLLVRTIRYALERRRYHDALMEIDTHFKVITDRTSDVIFTLDAGGKILSANQAVERVFGYSPSELTGQLITILIPESTQYLSEQPERRPIELPGKDRTGQTLILEVWFAISSRNGKQLYIGIIRDITEHKSRYQAVLYQAEFQKLITEISTAFMKLPPEQTDVAINRALQQVAEFAGVDRSYVVLLYDNLTKAESSHEWCAPGIPSRGHIRDMPVANFSWWIKKLKGLDVIHIPRVRDLPAAAKAEREFLESGSIQSVVVVPLFLKNVLVGFLGLDSIRTEKNWPEEVHTLLKVLGEVFVNALDRKNTGEAVRASEKKYRSLFENVLDGVFQTTPDGRILTVNPAMVRILGYDSEQELLATPARNFYFNPAERDSWAQKLEQEGELHSVRMTLKRKDGEPVIVLENAKAIRDEKGSVLYYEGTSTDITERQIAEDALIESIQFNEEVISGAGEGIAIYDRNLCCLVWNPFMEKLTGLPVEEVIGKRATELFPQLHENGILKLLERALAGERCRSQDVLYHIPQTGRSGWISGTYGPRRDRKGEITGVIGIITDITDRKQAEEALQKSEEKWRSLIENAPNFIATLDRQGMVLFVNRVPEGFALNSVMGTPVYDYVPLEEHTRLRQSLERVFQTGEQDSFQIQGAGSFGATSWYRVSIGPMWRGGIVDAVMLVATDITESKKNEKLQSALYRIADLTSSAEDIQQLFSGLHGIVGELMYATNFYIALYDETHQILSFPYYADEQDPPPDRKTPGKGLTEYVLRTGQPLLADPITFEELRKRGEVESYGSPSLDWLGVPLKRSEKTFGAMVIQSYSEKIRFGQKEKDILTFVSQHIATAVERKWSQDALRESESRLRVLIERMPAILWTTDTELRFTSSSGAALSALSLKPDQAAGLTLYEYFQTNDPEFGPIAAHYKALRGESITYEASWQQRTYQSHVQPLRSHEGVITGTIGVSLDITERKHAEQELERSLSLLRATLESTADGILVVSQDGKWISFNRTFVKMWRIPEAIVNSRDEGMMLSYVLKQLKDPDRFLQKTKELYDKPDSESYDVLEFVDGRIFERYSLPQLITGKSVGRVWSFSDVTEQKRGEALQSALYRIAEKTSSAEDIQEFYTAIHRIVGELMYAKNFYIALIDEEKQILTFPYFVDEVEPVPEPQALERGQTEYVLRTGQPLLTTPEIFSDLVAKGEVVSVGPPSVDWLGVPLKSGEKTFGVLVVQSYTAQVRYGEKEKEVLTFVSQHIAAALERKQGQESLRKFASDLETSLSVLRATLESTADGILVVDGNGRITTHNQRFVEMWRIPSEIIGSMDDSQALEFVLDQLKDPDGFLSKVQELYISPNAESHDILEFKDGRVFERHSRPQRIGGKSVGRVWSFSDVTERKRAEESVRESAERYALAALGANDGLWDWNIKTNEIYFSPRWKSMLGYSMEEIGNKPEEWFFRIHPDDLSRVQAELSAHLDGSSPHFQTEQRILHKDGDYRWMLTRGIAVPDFAGRPSRMAGSQTDVTDRKTAEERLMHEAIHDVLTGLPNRALFMDLLARSIGRAKRRDNYQFAVLFLDLDRFKIVNDSLGHMIGDELLKTISQRLYTCLRPGDTVARLGGDEFTILLDDVNDVNDATRVAERIQQELTRPFSLSGQEVFTSASLGIALSATGYDRPEDVLRDADLAMYRAKTLGKARHEVFDKAMHARAVALLQLETDLRRALERNEFRVFYQPTVLLDNGEITGVEALIRWQHPDRGLVLPMDFIPNAEETGLIVPIGRWVLREACFQMRRWQLQLGRKLSISVNLSPKQFAAPDLIEQVGRIIEETGIDPRLLILEITEGVLIENPESATRMLKQLKSLNVQLHIDDFGTGYSSLSYLQRFPIDTLKIDRSFVSGISSNGENQEIVRAIITLAHGLGMDVIAEGVENNEQLEFLRSLQCESGQGFFFSEPIAAPQALELIQSKKSP